MTNQEAIKTVQDRIDELISSAKIQIKMIKMHNEGKTDDEIHKWLTMAAVGTLCGIKKEAGAV